MVGSGPRWTCSVSIFSLFSRLYSAVPKASWERRERNRVGAPSRAVAMATLKGPPPRAGCSGIACGSPVVVGEGTRSTSPSPQMVIIFIFLFG